jgi:hypothetical protein
VALLVAILLTLQSSARPDCPDAQACRQAALEAAARQDYETFHDLAWRAAQKGRPNDPDLMFLLARAQSLSGRPGDALVMLTRLAERGIVTDAATNDDFRRVRALPGWTAFTAADEERRRVSKSNPSALPSTSAAPAAVATNRSGEEALHFSAPPFVPAGLAYDAVSRRFIAGDRAARKLVVIDEPSHHVANLAGAQSAGFGEITALEIDRHEGDLWVASVEAGSSTLHKLQLISGRVIYSVTPSRKAGAVRFVDVAVASRSTILAIDAEGRRLFALTRGSRTLKIVAEFKAEDPASVAPAGDRVAYVTSRTGITRIDLGARTAVAVKAPHDVDLSGLRRIRVHHGCIVGFQKTADGNARAIRVRLNAAGTRARALDVLDAVVSPFGELAASITGDVLYYLSGTDGDGAVRRIKLK